MVFNYIFTEQAGPSYYSEQTDEEFYDTEDYEWEYEVDEEDISEALVSPYIGKYSLRESCKEAINDLMSDEDIKTSLEELEVNSIDEAFNNLEKEIEDYNQNRTVRRRKISAYEYLNYFLGDITYYVEEAKMEEDLKDYFYDDAHREFRESY